MTGKNQSYARELNNQLVMRELRSANCSATMLSHKLNLSNAALSAIISDLLKNGYIKETESGSIANSLGRKPVYYTINENFGYVAVVSFMDYFAKVVVSDMKMNIIDSVETRVERYDVAMLYELILTVKNLLNKPEYRDVPLLGIDLSVPGKVNNLTGELQLSPQFDKDIFSEKNRIVNLFAKQFAVPVMMTNDINLAGLGEMHSGLLKDVRNGMAVHVDEGIGGALILGGKLYSGEHGFAGEIGVMRTEFMGRTDALDEFVSLRAVKNYFSQIAGRKLHTADIAELYRNDIKAAKYINETAMCLGKVLKDVVELLDISVIVISGRVRLFGETYLDIVNAEINKSINNAKAVFSELGGQATILGAVSKAVEALTDDIFK